MDRNRVIGAGNRMPWHLPADLKHFRALTMGKPIVMGRKTFESIGGKPLPGRLNIVLTRDPGLKAEGVRVVTSIAEALGAAGGAEELMVIGGAEVYRQFLALAQRVHLTEIDATFDGDAYFPQLPAAQWREADRQTVPADERNAYTMDFVVYERLPS